MPFCAYCGRELAAGAMFCSNCGKPVATSTTAITSSPETPTTPAQQPITTAYQQVPTTRPPYAGELERIIAVLIDTFIVALVIFILLIPFGFARLLFGASFLFGLDLLIFWVFWLLYFTYFESTTGQTLGKQLLHIRVVDETTLKRLELGPALIRNIFRIIDWLPFLYIIGIVVIAIDRQKRRLGDIVAHSIVIKA